MRILKYMLMLLTLTAVIPELSAQQVDKKDVRRGNRDFRKENYQEAEIDYRKALVKDSTSVAANYNLANALYRMDHMQQAADLLDRVKDSAPATLSAADYFFNRGDVALAMKDYQRAVESFGKSLLLRPDDLQAKENFIYAKKMLQNQQGSQQGNQNQDQNQDQQNNQDQNQDQQGQDDRNQGDDQQDQNDQGQDDRNSENPPKISPQAAQQMLQAIQAKEKETQEKVKEQKARALKSRQREKNW